MSELVTGPPIQMSVLDRLLMGATDTSDFSVRSLVQAVRRDLEDLLNSRCVPLAELAGRPANGANGRRDAVHEADVPEELRHSILDVAVPMLRVPIRPGRNITSIIEVAARNQLLKYQGKHSAREFQDRLNRALIEAKPEQPRLRVDEVE